MKLIAAICLLISFSASAGPFDYDCYSFYWNGEEDAKGTMFLSIKGKTAVADVLEENWDELGGPLNRSYQSRGRREFLKFGRELIVEKCLMSGGRRLRDGNWGGIVRVEGETEGGYYQYKFICKLR